MFRAGRTCAGIGTRFRLQPTEHQSSSSSSSYSSKTSNTKKESNVSTYDESYRQLDNLDFPTAAKILFSDQPKKKKFGLDFHLVQLFFACMPSFAVFLVAQYARYEMRRMEAERDDKNRIKDEEHRKEMELKEAEEQAKREFDPVIIKVKERLDQLEETLKEIVAGSRKQSDDATSKSQQQGDAKAVEAEGTTRSSSTAKQMPNLHTPGSDQHRGGKVTSASDSCVQGENNSNQKDEPTKEIKK